MFQYAIPKTNRKLSLQESEPGSKVIVDDVILFNTNMLTLMAYFFNMSMLFMEHRVAIDLVKKKIPTKTGIICRYWHVKVRQKT